MLLRSYLGSIASVAEVDGYAATIDGLPGGPPLAHWRLGEASGTQIVDRKAGARHGAYAGTIGHGAAGLPQSSDAAVDFAGTGYGEIAHDAGLVLSAFSLSFWFRLHSFPSTEGEGRHVLLSKGQVGLFLGDMDLMIEDDGTLTLQFQTASAQHQVPTHPALTLETPYHLVVRADNTGFDAYLNGAYLGKNTNYTDAWASNAQALRLGTAPWLFTSGGSWPTDAVLLDGILDEVALYNRVLTEAEVLQLSQYSAVPVASNDTYVVPEDTTTVLNVVSNDTYAGQKSALAVEIVSQGAHGTATVRADNDIDFAAAQVEQHEPDSFTYRITDAFGQSDPATVDLTVQDSTLSGSGDGLGGTLVYEWAPLGSWIDGVPLANRDTNDIAVSGETSWWTNGATVGPGLVKSVNALGINRLCWNRAPTGHPSLEIKTSNGSNAALGMTVRLYDTFATNPRHLRVVIELKLCNPADPTTYKLQGFDPSPGAYPDWNETHSNPDVGGKYFFGQWMGGGTDGSCQTNWWNQSSFPIGRGSHRTGWNGGGKGVNTYSYNYGRSTGCGEPTDYLSSLRMTSPGIATGWHRIENEVRLTSPSLANSTWGSFGTKPTGGDGFNKIFITPDIDQEVGVPAVRVLHSNLQNVVFNTTMNNYHQTVSLGGVFLNLFYGGLTPAGANAWSWIRKIEVYHYPEDDV